MIQKEVKARQETIEGAQQANRPDLISKAEEEIEAKSKAKLEYFNDPSGLDYYASNYMDSELISDFESEWQVTEIKKKEL